MVVESGKLVSPEKLSKLKTHTDEARLSRKTLGNHWFLKHHMKPGERRFKKA